MLSAGVRVYGKRREFAQSVIPSVPWPSNSSALRFEISSAWRNGEALEGTKTNNQLALAQRAQVQVTKPGASLYSATKQYIDLIYWCEVQAIFRRRLCTLQGVVLDPYGNARPEIGINLSGIFQGLLFPSPPIYKAAE